MAGKGRSRFRSPGNGGGRCRDDDDGRERRASGRRSDAVDGDDVGGEIGRGVGGGVDGDVDGHIGRGVDRGVDGDVVKDDLFVGEGDVGIVRSAEEERRLRLVRLSAEERRRRRRRSRARCGGPKVLKALSERPGKRLVGVISFVVRVVVRQIDSGRETRRGHKQKLKYTKIENPEPKLEPKKKKYGT